LYDYVYKGVGGITPGTNNKDMGRTIRGGPAHKIKACGARHFLAFAARLQEGILKIEIDLIGYAR
jgi:hypothetical protein